MGFSYALYGVRSTKLESIRDLVARALGREFGGRESEYFDVYYATRKGVDPRIIIKRNWDHVDKRPHWPEHKGFGIVISVHDAQDYQAIDKALKSDPRIDPTLIEHDDAFPEGSE